MVTPSTFQNHGRGRETHISQDHKHSMSLKDVIVQNLKTR